MQLLPAIALFTLVACEGPEEPETLVEDTAQAGTTVDTATTEVEDETDPEHLIGRTVAAFSLEDLNPSSATYGAQVSSQELAGRPYALIFLDSRCVHVPTVADDLWATYSAHPAWFEAMPVFGIESVGAYDIAPERVEDVIDGNDLPYLLDTEEAALWRDYAALNHDWFAISAEGTLEAWLTLYTWPDDLVVLTDYMEERFPD